MYIDKTLSIQNLEGFDFEKTKKNINAYFLYLEKLQWELGKLNTQKGLTVNYDFSVEYKKQPYIPIGKDVFNLSAKDYKEEELKKYISTYHWAKSVLTDKEQLYITECFLNRRYEDEFVELLGFNSSDSSEFRKLKRSAICGLFKFNSRKKIGDLEMERKKLINEIADFGIEYGIFNKSLERKEIKDGIELILSDCPGVEDIINRIIVKANSCQELDIVRLKTLLLELEKIRLELEYRDI